MQASENLGQSVYLAKKSLGSSSSDNGYLSYSLNRDKININSGSQFSIFCIPKQTHKALFEEQQDNLHIKAQPEGTCVMC